MYCFTIFLRQPTAIRGLRAGNKFRKRSIVLAGGVLLFILLLLLLLWLLFLLLVAAGKAAQISSSSRPVSSGTEMDPEPVRPEGCLFRLLLRFRFVVIDFNLIYPLPELSANVPV